MEKLSVKQRKTMYKKNNWQDILGLTQEVRTNFIHEKEIFRKMT